MLKAKRILLLGASWLGLSLISGGCLSVTVVTPDTSSSTGPKDIQVHLGSSWDWVGAGVVDTGGDVFLTGGTGDSVNGIDVPAGVGTYGFLVKATSTGSTDWTELIPSNTNSADWDSMNVAVDGSGDAYATGTSDTSLNGVATQGPYLAKYDPNGNRLWIEQIQASDVEVGGGVGVDQSTGDAYETAGCPSGGCTVGGVAATSQDTFLIKYDSAGNNKWQVGPIMGNFTHHSCVVVDSANHYAYTSIIEAGASSLFPTDPSPTRRAPTLEKWDSSGTLIWSYKWESTGASGMDAPDGDSCAIDSSGNVYVSGLWNIATYGNPSDAFLVKYDPSGTQDWLVTTGTTLVTGIDGLAVDSSGNIEWLLNFTGSEGRIWYQYSSSGSLVSQTAMGMLASSEWDDEILADPSGALYLLLDSDQTYDGQAGTPFSGFALKYNSQLQRE